MRPLPDPPELPAAARPRWPAWNAPISLVAGLGIVAVAGFPVLPLVLLTDAGDALGAIALMLLILVQDAALVGSALFFASRRMPPRAWHFGLRKARARRTIVWGVLAFLALFAVETGYLELLGVSDSNVDDLPGGNIVADLAVAFTVIVVAPVTEEIFFRGFFYRALRTRQRVWSAALIDGVVFGMLHFTGPGSLVFIPVIVLFGVVCCIVYERTGSLFATIAIHAAFNTVASLGDFPVVALAFGFVVISACIVVPRVMRPAPAAFGAPA